MNATLEKPRPVKVETKQIDSANSISVSAGTNCPMGGDTGHGGRTILAIKNETSTDMRVEVDGVDYGNVDSIKLTFGGDSECDTLIEALRFALDTLTMQSEINGRCNKTLFCY